MSPEERQLLNGLFDRTRGAAANPRDREAEALITDAVKAQPYAPYLLAQTVLVQEQALRAANDRLQELEAQLQQAEAQLQQQQSGGFLSGLGSLFGGNNPPPRPQPPQGGPWGQQPPQGGSPQGGSPWGQQQQYAPPPPQGGPWGGAPQSGQWGGVPQQGGGFLKGALGAAAGVAGGVLLADSIRNLMGGHNNSLGIGDGFGGGSGISSGLGGGETVINNYYNDDSATRRADAQQDADQDQDDYQDAADYSNGNDDDYA